MSAAPIASGLSNIALGSIGTDCAVAARPTRIAIVLHDLRGGGAERACLRLAHGMILAGREVELVLVRRNGHYLSDIPPGVRLCVLNKPRVSGAILALAAHFRRTRPQAVLSALTHMNLATVIAARLSGVKPRLVLSERNQISCKAREASNWWQRALYRAVPLLYRAADEIVAVSSGVADDLVRFGRLPIHKVRVIHNPVFEPNLRHLSRASLAHPWFAPGAPPVILAVGRLHRQKGFDVLLRAFAIARARLDCRLIILGEGPERAALENAAGQIGLSYDIDMPGFVDNPFQMMARAGVFVLSSRWEGFPNALVEAMTCGAPVVATDCPSGPSEILENGRLGTLVPVDDAAALAGAIVATLSTRPDTQWPQERAQRFSVPAAAAHYLEALEGR